MEITDELVNRLFHAGRDGIRKILEEIAAAPVSEPTGWEGEEKLTPAQAWQMLCETPDITSPEEYPDHALITFEQLESYMVRAAPVSEPEPVAWMDAQELSYIKMVTGNGAWQDYTRMVPVGGNKEGRSPIYASPPSAERMREALEAVKAWADQANPAGYGGLPERVYLVVDRAIEIGGDA